LDKDELKLLDSNSKETLTKQPRKRRREMT
jgi:hypothetical protein